MEKRTGNRGACCLGASVLALALFAWMASYAVRGEPCLLDQSTRLIDASFWNQEFGSYFWENDRAVLTFRPEGKTVRAVSVDVSTRAETPHTALTREIARGGNDVVAWRLSRDGRLLLWCDLGGKMPIWTASDLSGKRVQTWKQASIANLPMWLTDNRRWLGAGILSKRQDPGKLFSSVGNVLGIYDVSGLNRSLAPTPGPCNWPVGITSDNHVVALHWVGPNAAGNGAIEWYEYSLDSTPTAGPHGKAVMPRAAAGLREAELSPDGGRIAVLVQYNYLSPVEQLLGRFLHVPVHSHQKVGLWVVNRGRGDASLVGSEEGPAPFGLLWSLDGQRLSYIQNGTLYSVAAPRH
jgi:hypothetical protein